MAEPRPSVVTIEEIRQHIPEPFGSTPVCARCGEPMPCMTVALWTAQNLPKTDQ